MTDFSKQAGGAVKIDFGVGTPQFVARPVNVSVKGKSLPFTVDPIVKKDKVFVRWDGGDINVWLDQLTIGGVPQTVLADAVASLATIFNGQV